MHSGGVRQSRTWYMPAVGEFDSLDSLEFGIIMQAVGEFNSLELYRNMHAVGEFDILELGTCLQWGSSTVSNLLHACSGGVRQSRIWYYYAGSGRVRQSRTRNMHAVGEFDSL